MSSQALVFLGGLVVVHVGGEGAAVIDPAKVTRNGLMNACSIAGIMLTIQVRWERVRFGGFFTWWCWAAAQQCSTGAELLKSAVVE